MHDVASILKEFFKDLPEPLLPREVYHPLLAIQSKILLDFLIKRPGFLPEMTAM